MKTLSWAMVMTMALALQPFAAKARTAAAEADGLVKVKSTKVEQAYLLPGADFSIYKKVMLAPSRISFQKDWLRNMNQGSLAATRVNDAEANRILNAARSGFDEIWSEAFVAAGYAVVHEPGPDVLEVLPSVFDLYINAPDVPTAFPTKVYTVETGQASLALDVRDSVSGALLGRAIDRRTAGLNMDHFEWTTRVTNRSDFRQLFAQWAKLAAQGLGELAKASPLPDKLQPGKKLPRRDVH